MDQRAFKITREVAAERRARVVSIVEGLPEAGVVAAGNHLSLEVRQKRFGWYLDDHHGDGRLAINCKAPRGVAQQLAKHAPARRIALQYLLDTTLFDACAMPFFDILLFLSGDLFTVKHYLSGNDFIFYP